MSTEPDRDLVVHEQFAAHAARHGDAVAVTCGDRSITARDLDTFASRLARALRDRGVGPESPVGIALDPSIPLVAAVLATWKAGGAYVPLDAGEPAARLRDRIAHAAARVIVTDGGGTARIGDVGAMLIDVDEPLPPASPDHSAMPTMTDQLAYIMYTSGSTGDPKGVMIAHGAMGNHLRWMQRVFPLTPDDRVLQKAPFGFDASVYELCAPLMTGARLVVAEPGVARDPAALIDLMAEQGVTTLKIVPSLLRALIDHGGLTRCVALRRVFCGAEVMPPDLPRALFDQVPVELYNLYGPTETAIDVTGWRCAPADRSTRVPIGRPIDRTQIHILDERGHAVPPNVTGELYVGGASLGRGYWRRPDLTAERFVPSPSPRTTGARLYRTGDRARWRADGVIEYIGRLDRQVKVRGIRVEPGEIEMVLGQLDAIRESVVLAVPHETSGLQLAAYVVPAQGRSLTIADVREHLAQRLSSQSLPSQIVILPELPRLPNGKVDGRVLSAIANTPPAGTESRFAGPRTAIERTLVEIWQDTLRVPRVGIHDDFFDLGGDSIVSIQVVAHASRRGLKVRVRQIFEHRTIAALSAVVTTSTSDAAPTPRTPPPASPADIPLTPIAQQFFEQRLANPHYFNQAILLAVDDVTIGDLERLAAWWQTRHDALRLRYRRDGHVWRQRSTGPSRDDSRTRVAACVDLSGVAPDAWRSLLEREATVIQASLDITHGPLLRVVLVRGGLSGDRVLIVVHHLAIDGVSWRLLLADWPRAEEPHATASDAIAASASFQHWAEALAAYAQSSAVAADASGWLAQASPRVAALPVDHPAGANTIALADTVSVALDADETRALLQQAPRLDVSLHEVLLASVALAVREWTGATRVRLDVEGHGREDAIDGLDVSRTVGWFTTMSPLVIELASGPPVWTDVLAAVAMQVRQLPRRGFTYGLLRYLHHDAALRASLAAMPRAEISVNYLGQFEQARAGETSVGAPATEPRFARESTGPTQHPADPRTHEIQCTALIVGGRLRVQIAYSRDRYERATMAALADSIRRALDDTRAAAASTDVAARVSAADRLLVELRTSGSDLPIFCAAPYGDPPAFVFRDLAHELGAWHPMYGLRVPEDPDFSYEAIAARHVEEIRRARPSGPYLLAGFSLGGLVAFEVARQLSAAGSDVPAVILFETVCPTTQIDVRHASDGDLLAWILRGLDPGIDWAATLRDLPDAERVARLHALARTRPALASKVTRVARVEDFLDLWRRRAAYVPRDYGGQVLLFRTSDPSILDETLTHAWARDGEHARSLGWRLIVPERLTLIDAPGAHANVLFRPHARRVAADLRAWLTRHLTHRETGHAIEY
jgi:amino acid adenylation domain-containing protein/non-ribosomal peptide synthase protein (TIGR01720 family)